MMRVTNIAKGPRGIHTLAGTVYLDPGQTGDYEMADAEALGVMDSPYFTVGESDPEPVAEPEPEPEPEKPVSRRVKVKD